MDLLNAPTEEAFKYAEGKAHDAYTDIMDKYCDGRQGMTVAEAIGLPRMFREPWDLTERAFTMDVAVTLTDVALAYAYLAVWGDIATALRWRLDKSEAQYNLELLIENEKVIAHHIQFRERNKYPVVSSDKSISS